MGILPKQLSAMIPENVRQPTKRLLQQLSHSALTKVSGGKENALLWSYSQFKLSPYLIVQGYCQGMYPLPNMTNGKIIDWFDPEVRGIIPVENFKVRNDLLRVLKKEKYQNPEKKFEIKVDADFHETIVSCSKPRGSKTKTWLTPDYIKASIELHKIGIAHSVETYQNGVLVGGVVGLAINGQFITLSLFNTVDNAGKVAFYYLLVKLRDEGFKLHYSGAADSWFTQFGSVNIQKDEFRKMLIPAITAPVKFTNNVPQLLF
jgi:leucyl/phenylalanyl-tRNA--protein transferase